jgi:hypothetical protein
MFPGIYGMHEFVVMGTQLLSPCLDLDSLASR